KVGPIFSERPDRLEWRTTFTLDGFHPTANDGFLFWTIFLKYRKLRFRQSLIQLGRRRRALADSSPFQHGTHQRLVFDPLSFERGCCNNHHPDDHQRPQDSFRNHSSSSSFGLVWTHRNSSGHKHMVHSAALSVFDTRPPLLRFAAAALAQPICSPYLGKRDWRRRPIIARREFSLLVTC